MQSRVKGEENREILVPFCRAARIRSNAAESPLLTNPARGGKVERSQSRQENPVPKLIPFGGEKSAKPPQKLTTTHEAILNWLVANPGRSLKEGADLFGYTQSWFSTMVNSDLFQAELAKRQADFRGRLNATLTQRLQTVAHVALDKLATMVEGSEDKDFVLEVSDKVLHRLGFAPQSNRNPAGPIASGPLFQTNLYISKDDLHAARAIMERGPGEVVDAEALEPLGELSKATEGDSGEEEQLPLFSVGMEQSEPAPQVQPAPPSPTQSLLAGLGIREGL